MTCLLILTVPVLMATIGLTWYLGPRRMLDTLKGTVALWKLALLQ